MCYVQVAKSDRPPKRVEGDPPSVSDCMPWAVGGPQGDDFQERASCGISETESLDGTEATAEVRRLPAPALASLT